MGQLSRGSRQTGVAVVLLLEKIGMDEMQSQQGRGTVRQWSRGGALVQRIVVVVGAWVGSEWCGGVGNWQVVQVDQGKCSLSYLDRRLGDRRDRYPGC